MQLPSFLSEYEMSPLEYHYLARDWSAEMRKTHPALYDAQHSAWLVFSYDDTARVRSDYKTFSSESMVNEGEYGNTSNTTVASMDPPRHTQMRSLVTQAFSARTIAAMAPQIESIARDILGPMRPGDEIDWVAQLANPLPVIVIADMLGLPREEWPSYKTWTEEIVHNTPNRPQASRQFAMTFARAVEEHKRNPRNDVLTLLLNAEVDGQRLSFEQVRAFFVMIFVAGNITTTNMLSNMILCLDEHPDQFERLQQQPELLTSAIEEILRYMPPVRIGASDLLDGRRVTTDVCMGGQLIREGERVALNSLPANFDPARFSNPDCFDIARNPNRHLSFGHGVHFCLGSPLARLELKIVLGMVLERFPSLKRVREEPIQLVNSSLMFGPRNLPVTL